MLINSTMRHFSQPNMGNWGAGREGSEVEANEKFTLEESGQKVRERKAVGVKAIRWVRS